MGFDAKLELAIERASDGTRLSIAPWSAVKPLGETGISELPFHLSRTERMGEVGADVGQVMIGGREITLRCRIEPDQLEAGWRERLAAFFLPGMKGTLWIDRGKETGDRKIAFHLADVDMEQASIYKPMVLTLGLFCPDPWFRGAEQVTPLMEKQPLLSFPFTSVYQGGVTSGYGERTSFLHPQNPGDTECGVRVELRVIGGRVIDPYIVANGQRLTVKCEAAEGDRITICTEAGARCVLLNGKAVPFERESVFFTAKCGSNLMMVSHKGGDGELDGEIRLTPCYFSA